MIILLKKINNNNKLFYYNFKMNGNKKNHFKI